MIWINGPFGGGKTTTAEALVGLRPELRTYDPEHVGYLLLSSLQGIDIDHFQDLEAWRKLVPAIARLSSHSSERESTCRRGSPGTGGNLGPEWRKRVE